MCPDGRGGLPETGVGAQRCWLPWQADELEAVRFAFEELARTPVTNGLRELPQTGAGFAEDFAGWGRLRDDPDPAL